MKYVLDAMGFDKYLALVEEKLGRKLDARARRGARAAPGLRPHRAYRRARAEAGRACTGSASCCRSASSPCEQMRGLAAIAQQMRRRRYPAHGLAEPADLRRADREDRGRRSRRSKSSASPTKASSIRAGPRRLHRQCRLPLRRLRHQAPRRGHRALVRGARRARRAGEHPSHRLPSFLRAALYRRYRPDRLQGRRSTTTATRSRAITSWSAAASGRDAGLAREIYTRREGARTRRRSSSACSRPIWRTAPRPTRRFQAFTRRHEIDALTQMFAETAA